MDGETAAREEGDAADAAARKEKVRVVVHSASVSKMCAA